jgi:type I restriction enzyme M protein
MDYWGETMQDDCYLIAADGWLAAAQPRLIVEDKASKTKTRPDFAVGRKKYAAELIPPALVIARYYAKEQAAIEALEAQAAPWRSRWKRWPRNTAAKVACWTKRRTTRTSSPRRV